MERYRGKHDINVLIDRFNNELSESTCAVNLINSYKNKLKIINDKIKYKSLFEFDKFYKNITWYSKNSDIFWNDFYLTENRQKLIMEIADFLGIRYGSIVGFKSSPEYALYFILLFYYCISEEYKSKIDIFTPYILLCILAIISPLILDTVNLRKIINMFSDICEKYNLNIYFKYICDTRGSDIDYTCGRYAIFDDSTNTIKIMQTISKEDDEVLFNREENISPQFTTNCSENTEDFQKKYIKYKKKYILLKNTINKIL